MLVSECFAGRGQLQVFYTPEAETDLYQHHPLQVTLAPGLPPVLLEADADEEWGMRFQWQGSGYDWGSGSWRRPSAASKGKVVDAAWEVVTRPAKTGLFDVGERVFHQKFGYGTVSAIDGNKLHVEFEKSDAKTVVDSYVEKT